MPADYPNDNIESDDQDTGRSHAKAKEDKARSQAMEHSSHFGRTAENAITFWILQREAFAPLLTRVHRTG